MGWNTLGSHIVSSLDEIAVPGSSVAVVYDPRLIGPDDVAVPHVGTLDVTVRPATGAMWHLLDDVDSSMVTAIVLLAPCGAATTADADGETLLNHMLLRRDLTARGGRSPSVLVELLDADNVDLAREAGADDSIVSDAITSRLLTQLAEQPERRPILLRLYAPGGASIRLIRAGDLGLAGEVGCGTVIATAYSAGLLAIGWRVGAAVRLNPPMTERVVLSDGDEIVAIG